MKRKERSMHHSKSIVQEPNYVTWVGARPSKHHAGVITTFNYNIKFKFKVFLGDLRQGNFVI